MIKKIYIFLVAIVLFQFGNAQSLQVYMPSYTITGGYTEPYLHAPATVTNTSATSKSVKVIRTEVSVVPGTVNYFCWDACYAPFVSVSGSLTLQPNVPSNDFYADYEPSNTSGVTIVRYKFYDENNVSDSTSITITYDATNAVASVKAENPVVNFASDPAPNPAVSYTDIQYRFAPSNETPSIKVFNINGKIVREVKMPSNEGNLKLSVSGMESGLYFYQFYSGNASTPVKKLIVN